MQNISPSSKVFLCPNLSEITPEGNSKITCEIVKIPSNIAISASDQPCSLR